MVDRVGNFFDKKPTEMLAQSEIPTSKDLRASNPSLTTVRIPAVKSVVTSTSRQPPATDAGIVRNSANSLGVSQFAIITLLLFPSASLNIESEAANVVALDKAPAITNWIRTAKG